MGNITIPETLYDGSLFTKKLMSNLNFVNDKIWISADSPVLPYPGQLWWDSNASTLSVWTGAVWYLIYPASVGGTLVKISGNDTTANYLGIKLVAGTGVVLTELSNGADERLEVKIGQPVAQSDSPVFAGMTINGNIIITGTVDGTDISVFKSEFDTHVVNVNAHHSAVTIAGAPLTLAGQLLTFNYDAADFQVSGNNLQVKDGGINHNSLSGLQGGIPGERNHLTNAQVASLPSSVTVEGPPLTMTGTQIKFNYDSADFQLSGNNLQIKDGGISHNSLSGLQGGVAGEYNHLTNAQISALHGSASVGGAPLTMAGQQISFNYDALDFQLSGNNLQVKDSGIDHGSIGGLADDDHAQYLRTDGTRTLTGDMLVSAGKKIDGIDLSAHAHNPITGDGSVPLGYVDRGNCSGWDKSTGWVFDTWTPLNIGGPPFNVPAAAKAVVIQCAIKGPSSGMHLRFKKTGNVPNTYWNAPVVSLQAGGVYSDACFVCGVNNQSIDYYVSSGLTEIYMGINGWFL